MAFCSQCGTNVQDGAGFCPQCGAKIAVAQPQQPQQAPPPQPQYQQQAPPPQPQQPYGYTAPQANPYSAYPWGNPPSGQLNTGMLIWSIVNIFLCGLLGIIALIFTITAKSQMTAELEQKKLQTAKVLNIISSIVGGLSIVISIIISVAAGVAVGDMYSYYY